MLLGLLHDASTISQGFPREQASYYRNQASCHQPELLQDEVETVPQAVNESTLEGGRLAHSAEAQDDRIAGQPSTAVEEREPDGGYLGFEAEIPMDMTMTPLGAEEDVSQAPPSSSRSGKIAMMSVKCKRALKV